MPNLTGMVKVYPFLFINIGNSCNILPRPVKSLSEMMQIVFIPTTNSSNAKPSIIPKVSSVTKQKCLAAIKWLQTNNPRYSDVEIANDFLMEPEYNMEIDETVSADNLNRYNPSHGVKTLNTLNEKKSNPGEFHEEEEEIHTFQQRGYEVEEITRSCLFTSHLEKETSETIALSGSINTWLNHSTKGLTAVVHEKDPLKFQENMQWIIDCYPTLFPEGLTGPNANRHIKVEMEDWIQYWLNVYDERYAMHYDFIFALYNLTQRKKVLDCTRYYTLLYFLICRFDVTGFPTIGVTANDIREQLDRLREKKNLNHKGVIQLLQQTRTRGSLVSHSPQRKIVLRANIFGIITMLGWPSFFITFNPNDLYSPILNLRQQKNTPDYEALLKILSSNGHAELPAVFNGNPASCAKYFKRVVESVLENVLGYDDAKKQYRTSMFGNVIAHFGAVEQQQRKQLHLHMIVWVEGLTDYNEFNQKIGNYEYRRKIVTYLNRLVRCSVQNPLQNIENIPNGSRYLCPNLNAETFQETFLQQLDWVQLSSQLHQCTRYHCLKRGRNCRYKFPKPYVANTDYCHAQHKMLYKRNNMFLNNCVPAIAVVGRFNTDIQFLPGNGDPRIARYIAYYCSNYTSKEESSNIHLLHYMNQKLADIQKYQPEVGKDNQRLFGSLLSKTVQKFAAANDVGAVEVASTLLGFSDHYTNFRFRSIDWKNWDLWLCTQLGDSYTRHTYHFKRYKESVYCAVLQRTMDTSDTLPIDLTHEVFDMKEKYLKRHCKLENFSIYEIESLFQFKMYPRDDEDLPANFYPLNDHDIEGDYVKGHQEIPNPVVPSLPWFNAKSRTHGVGTESFARIMCLLFRPFRSAVDLFDPQHDIFLAIYERWKEKLNTGKPPFLYMNNLEKNGIVACEASTEAVRRQCENMVMEYANKESDETLQWHQIQYHLPTFQLQNGSKNTAKEVIRNIVLLQLDIDAQKQERKKGHALYPLTNVYHLELVDYYDIILEHLNKSRTNSTCDKQWKVVNRVAMHIYNTTKKVIQEPLRMLVHGEGGTGKSWIIKVIQDILKLCNVEFCTGAPTGRAALGVNGDTIDSLFGFSYNGLLSKCNSQYHRNAKMYPSSA